MAAGRPGPSSASGLRPSGVWLRFEEVGLGCASLEGASMIMAADGEYCSIPTLDALGERLEGIEVDLREVAWLMSESF